MGKDFKDNSAPESDRTDADGKRTDRQARLAEALRENLRKRKAQARGRAAANPPTKDPETPA